MREARSALSEKESDAAWASGGGLTVDALQVEVREHFSSRSGTPQRPAHGLSRREIEIAGLVAAGMTSRAIADKLFLSERTVETHLTHIMTKLGFSSRAQVATWIADQRRALGPEG
ncbi:MAG: helix-turn-helix transcriptional regulator [Chloroflexi bacterium]|nr:MAG: helix-turn-helix transcriptional regulator [Chloroflexota bacterium]